MHLVEKVSEAKTNHKACNELIHEYNNFILSVSSKVTGKFVTEHDDEASVAMIAFHEAIQKYEYDKGKFLPFAALIIKNRLIDYMRREYKTAKVMTFSSLSQINKDGCEAKFDVEDKSYESKDIKYEIESLTEELEVHGISFLELSKVSPKSKKTRRVCFTVINYILSQPQLVRELKKSGTLPIKSILENLDANRKTIERHRKYIIAGLIILTGDYVYIAEYFSEAKGVIL